MLLMPTMSEILNRLKKRAKHLKKWAKREQIECYRLYNRDIPEYPYLIDIYKDNVILYDRGNEIDQEKEDHFENTLDALKEIFEIGLSSIYVKSRSRQKGDNQYKKVDKKEETIIVQEKQAKFHINLSDYLDSGLFLDHRPLRQIVFQESKNKSVLNLFSYTCSMGVFAALSGAHTTNVDLSTTYLDWGIKNYELNELPAGEHLFVKTDVKTFLEEDENTYDLIILDPPTFSNSKSMDYTFDIQKLAGEFVSLSVQRLSPNGKLYFSTNKRDFKWDPNWEEGFKVRDLSNQSIPEDFRDQKIHKLFLIEKI